MVDISDNLLLYQAQLQVLEICESLLESYTLLENSVNNLLNSITFSRLKIIQTLIITPIDLINSLKEISQVLTKENLSIRTITSNFAKYLELIELQDFQKDSKIIFVLKIPLVESETYTLFQVISLPIEDKRTGLHNVILTSEEFIALDDDSMLYVTLPYTDKCKDIDFTTKLYFDLLALPINSTAICEAQLLKQQIEP